MSDIIKCINMPQINMERQDGSLPHLSGVTNVQIKRPLKSKCDFTYNHAPMITSYNGRILISYVSSKKDEHGTPTVIAVKMSKDGYEFEDEQILFPALCGTTFAYRGPKGELLPKIAPLIAHHRMSFYKALDNTLLAVAFYGFSPDGHMAPNNGYGAVRVVRKINEDFTFSDIFVLKYNESAGFFKDNFEFYDENADRKLDISYYTESNDVRFVEACRELLSNRLVCTQWYEEESLNSDYEVSHKAISLFKITNGNYIGVCKEGYTYLFDDKGDVIRQEKPDTLITNKAKVWGQKLKDGYMLCYNPTVDSCHRWPLAVSFGKDNSLGTGCEFDTLFSVLPEINPYKYEGKIKNLGAQYVRGICDYNKENDDIYITFSTNKEDIWVSRLFGDENYSITKPFYANVVKSDNRFDCIDNDSQNRLIIERFRPHLLTKILLNVSSQVEDNPVNVVFEGDGHMILKSYLANPGTNEIDIPKDCVSVMVYSKAELYHNTLLEDGRKGMIEDIPDAENVSQNIKYSVTFIE